MHSIYLSKCTDDPVGINVLKLSLLAAKTFFPQSRQFQWIGRGEHTTVEFDYYFANEFAKAEPLPAPFRPAIGTFAFSISFDEFFSPIYNLLFPGESLAAGCEKIEIRPVEGEPFLLQIQFDMRGDGCATFSLSDMADKLITQSAMLAFDDRDHNSRDESSLSLISRLFSRRW